MSLKRRILSNGRMNEKTSENTVDHGLVVIILALLAFGLVMVFSAINGVYGLIIDTKTSACFFAPLWV